MGRPATPGYRAGFYSPARGGEPAYPGLWRGVVGAWCPSLGMSGTRLFDWSVAREHGTLTNIDTAVDWIQSQGNAIHFYGFVDNYVACHQTSRFVSYPFGVSFWFNATAAQPVGTGFGSNWGTYFIVYPNDNNFSAGGPRVYFHEGGANILYDAAGADLSGAWHHCFVMMRKSGDYELYLDGKSIANNATACASPTAATQCFLGKNPLGHPFSGDLDDFLVYHRNVSAGEIRVLSRYRGIAYELGTRSYKKPAAGGIIRVGMNGGMVDYAGGMR